NEVVDQLPLTSAQHLVKNFRIGSTIDDAQAAFNLNNLSVEEWTFYFQRLLLLVDPSLSADSAQKITKSVVNWISPASQNSEEDSYYTKLPLPYRPPHHPMASPSEFRLVKGVSASLYLRLLPYITALPEATLINVNTAFAPVLQCLSPSLSVESVRTIENYRRQVSFKSLEQFLNMDLVRNNAVPSSAITVNSSYFIIHTQVEKEEQQLTLITLMHRLFQKNKMSIQILWQTKGGI
ncbi:MAG TPA: type II secretion system minor pseudopilin GspK, partial [Gammaproteobacteria bacterium]|nr:type II secretion system minor pseudopilin GspK [Gammaproteobacteria bacterium]